MIELELENTYLIKYVPDDLQAFPSKEIIDIYIPAADPHPCLRLRKRGGRYEITKKQPVNPDDASAQNEHTISLNEAEFSALAGVKGKRARKIRYEYDYKGDKAEIDVFQDDLAGLVVVDFEFSDPARRAAFKMPDFCLADITQDKTFAGGMLCGKRYSDIEKRLNEYGYVKMKQC